jgi:hypothetical protein
MEVYKYPLPVSDVVELEMPIGAEILYVDTQRGDVCLWARVEPGADTEARRFRFAGTGHELGDGVGRHVGSCLMHEGRLVFHIFEME